MYFWTIRLVLCLAVNPVHSHVDILAWIITICLSQIELPEISNYNHISTREIIEIPFDSSLNPIADVFASWVTHIHMHGI